MKASKKEGPDPEQVVPTQPPEVVAHAEGISGMLVATTESSRDELSEPASNVNPGQCAPSQPQETTGTSKGGAAGVPEREKESGGGFRSSGIGNTMNVENNAQSRSLGTPSTVTAFVEAPAQNSQPHVGQPASSLHNITSSPKEVFETKPDEAESDRNTGANVDNPISQRAVLRGRGFGVKNLAMMRARSAGGADDSKDEVIGEEETKAQSSVGQAEKSEGQQAGIKEACAISDTENRQNDEASEAIEFRESISASITPSEGADFAPTGADLSANVKQGGEDSEPCAIVDIAGELGVSEEPEKESSAIDAQRNEEAMPTDDSTV